MDIKYFENKGFKLRYAVSKTDKDCKGTILLIQGRTEFIEKHFENIQSFNKRGFEVFTMDLRGQGLSDRILPERLKGHIENSINLPLGKFSEKVSTLEKNKNQTIIVVCQTGTRSVTACKTLTKAGFEQVFNITGGMQSWEDSKLPIKVTSKNKDK